MGPTRVILGTSPQVKDLLKLIAKVAPAKTNVLVIGDSGTGKELVARMIHESGPLKGKPFVPVNCGAIPETLIESELFGHVKGSFTGAVSDKPGLFEVANTGTLFLDEVGELPLSMQVKILRAIQERSFRRVGGNHDVKVDVRIIAATNRNLETAVAKGTFREDLYYRLNVILIKTPALRERTGDIAILAEAFLKRAVDRLNASGQKREIRGFDPKVLRVFELHSWPGNIRELENVVERAVTLETGPVITLGALVPQISGLYDGQDATPTASEGSATLEELLPEPDFSAGPLPLAEILSRIQAAYYKKALDFTQGDEVRAHSLLGLEVAKKKSTPIKKKTKKPAK